jgi:hypothetical protein
MNGGSVIAEQIESRDAKGDRELIQRAEREILLRSLNGPDVGAMQIGPGTQFFLTPSALGPKPADGAGDNRNRASTLHACTVQAC